MTIFAIIVSLAAICIIVYNLVDIYGIHKSITTSTPHQKPFINLTPNMTFPVSHGYLPEQSHASDFLSDKRIAKTSETLKIIRLLHKIEIHSMISPTFKEDRFRYHDQVVAVIKQINERKKLSNQIEDLKHKIDNEITNAGEAGNNFAEIADEMGKLAQQSSEISSRIDEIMSDIGREAYYSAKTIATMVDALTIINRCGKEIERLQYREKE